MKYVLVFVLLTCVLSASIKERMETAAAEGVQEKTFLKAAELGAQEECEANPNAMWVCHPTSTNTCWCESYYM
jgi:hypothetical protein